MKPLLLALLLGATPAFAAPAPLAFPDLVGGRYTLTVEGMLCRACARAINEELSHAEEVASAAADFEKNQLVITIKTGKSMPSARLRKALKRAARRVNLGNEFEIRAINYQL